jgi:hypothetical protein
VARTGGVHIEASDQKGRHMYIGIGTLVLIIILLIVLT